MRKQLRSIIISVCVVAVLAIGIIVVKVAVKPKPSPNQSSSSTPAIQVFKTDSSKVTAVHVTNKNGTFTINQAGGKFSLSGVNVPLNTDSLKSAVTSVSDLEATKLVVKGSTDLSQYGLQNPVATVDVTAGDGTVSTIDIGNNTPSADGCYVAMKGSSDVYIGDSTLNSTFSGTELNFVNLTLASIDQTTLNDLTSLSFGGTAHPSPIVLDEDKSASSSSSAADSTSSDSGPTYLMKSPRNYAVDPDKVSTITDALQSLSASQALTLDMSEANLKKYGLDKPQYTFSFTYKGKQTTFEFGTSYTDSSTGTTYLPLIDEGTPVIYAIDASTVTFYNWQLKDICSDLLFSDNIDTVKSVTITSGGQSYTFNLSGTGDNLVATYGSKKLDTENFRYFYEALAGINFEGSATKPTGGSDYAHFEVTFRDKAKAPVEMDFISMGNRQSFWSINGEGDFYVLNEKLDTVIQDAQKLAAGKTVTEPN